MIPVDTTSGMGGGDDKGEGGGGEFNCHIFNIL
jgi:hypothetical protein